MISYDMSVLRWAAKRSREVAKRRRSVKAELVICGPIRPMPLASYGAAPGASRLAPR